MSAAIQVTATGPVFDGRAARAADRAVDDVRDSIAEYAEERVLADMGAHFQRPTGYYESRVTTTRTGDMNRVHDQGVVYGPWLEGVGSRNAPVTRFAGYSHWRRTKAHVQGVAPAIAERAVQRHLPEMRG